MIHLEKKKKKKNSHPEVLFFMPKISYTTEKEFFKY